MNIQANALAVVLMWPKYSNTLECSCHFRGFEYAISVVIDDFVIGQ